MDFDGQVLKSFDREVTIAPLASHSYFDVTLTDLLEGRDAKNSYVYCELLVGGKVASSHDYFFAPFKELRLPKPSIIFAVAPTRGGFRVTINSDKFAKAVYLSVDDHDGSFSDNYFDLIPGKPVAVEYHGRAPFPLRDFRERLTIRSMVDAF